MNNVHHSAICVADIDESLRFWRDGLGFEVLLDHEFPGDWPELFGVSTTSLRSVFLGDPDVADAEVVELVDFHEQLDAAPRRRRCRAKSGNGVLRERPAVKYAWIDEMASRRLWWFSVALACELLEVSTSGFYDWRARRHRPATRREREQQLLVAAITVEHIASRQRYGSPRIHAELVDQGWRIGENRMARLMAVHGIVDRAGRRRRHHLTRQAKTAPHVPDLVERDFTAEAPDRKWATDISYVPATSGWVYLAVILDLCSKAVVGWAVDTHMRTELVLDALTMALQTRRPGPGLIVHSDRGAQFTSQPWLDALDQVDARASMGRVGVCWDCDDAGAAVPDGLTRAMTDHGVLALTCRPSGQQQPEWLASRASSDLIGA